MKTKIGFLFIAVAFMSMTFINSVSAQVAGAGGAAEFSSTTSAKTAVINIDDLLITRKHARTLQKNRKANKKATKSINRVYARRNKAIKVD